MFFRNLGFVAPFFTVSFFFAPWNLALANQEVLDASFGNGGKSSTDITGQLLDDAVGDMALLPDGRLLIAGTTSSGVPTEHDVAVLALKPDGTVDASFGQAGRVLIDRGGNEFCYAIALQPDGRIILGGYRTALTGGPPETLILRLNPDGALDSTFGNQGAFQPALPFSVAGLAVLPDGRIIAAGSRPSPSGSDFAIASMTSTGVLNGNFGEGGVVILDFGGDDYLTGVSVDTMDRLLVVGLNTSGAVELSRLLPDGSPDQTFSGSGRKVIDLGCSYDVSAIVQGDGKILLGTTAGTPGATDFLLARLNPDGSLDARFGVDGIVTGDLTGTDDYLTQVIEQPDGKIAAIGWAGFYPDFLVQCYNSDGSVDRSFGPGGWAHTDFSGDQDRARAAVIQADGKLVLSGDVPGSDFDESRDFGLARYDLAPGAQAAEVSRVARSSRGRSGQRFENTRMAGLGPRMQLGF